MQVNFWKITGSDGVDYTIELFSDHIVISSDIGKRTFSYTSLFESHAPLDLFTAQEKQEIFFYVVTTPGIQVPETRRVQVNFDFWKCVTRINLSKKIYEYETKITNISKWKLEVSAEGLVYHDLSCHYYSMPKAYHQTLSDFWFYGPLYPIPDITLRTNLVHTIQGALVRAGFLFPDSHHRILTYPEFISPPMWEEGDYHASNFVILRNYGIEYGRQNFHDGLVGLGFISFEHGLNREDCINGIFTKEIRESVIEIVENAQG